MDNNKDGGSINRPPVLDGSNYDYWKARMIAILISMDNKSWKAIIKGGTHPLVTAEDGTISKKPEAEWTDAEDIEALAKEAWEILQTTLEGTSKVCMSKLQLLTTKFENLRMEQDETISEFNTRLRDIANSSFALGGKMSEEKLARKILRSLPKRFNMKVTTIEEAQDLSTIKVDELIGLLQTFEMAINYRTEKKNKNTNFVSEENLSEDNLSEAMALIGRKFNKSLNKLQAKWRTNVSDKRSNIRSQSKVKDEDNSDQDKGIRCFECEENEGETDNKAFIGKYETSRNKYLVAKWEESCLLMEHQKKIINALTQEKEILTSTAANLKKEVTPLNLKLANTTKPVRMLNKEFGVLEKASETRKNSRDMKGSKSENYKRVKTAPKRYCNTLTRYYP
ncbi:gag-pol polyprotein [Trifolium medium]|uniref:Gag-pol polyprotein n=1 Tax=Trifolium medium TaxID=97028 RepID=A0A392MMQ4_9FABA|nr:gag-pol polyprotein [Trifolium medium]